MLGTPFAGFAGNAGTEQVAQQLATIPAAGENPSLCYSTGECLQATQLSPLLPLPCPSLLQGGPPSSLARHPSTGVQEAHGDTRHTLHRQTPGHSACTGTHAHRLELPRHRLPACWTARAPAPPGWSPWLSALGYGREQERCQQLVCPSACWSQHGGEPSHRSPRRCGCLAACPPTGLSVGPSHASKEPKRSPADQPEPGKAVVERVSASHHIVTVLDDTGRHFCCSVIHLTHQVQALPAGTGDADGGGETQGCGHPNPPGTAVSHPPQLLQGPVMCCPVLLVLHLYSHDGPGEWSLLPVLGSIGRQQVGRERRVQRVREEHKLELDLERGRGAGETPGRAGGFMCSPW